MFACAYAIMLPHTFSEREYNLENIYDEVRF